MVPLAASRILWLSIHIPVHREHEFAGFGRVTKPALVGLLALLLLASATLSVSQSLHQWIHADGDSGSHFCLVCSLAKGQVTASLVATTLVSLVLCWDTVGRALSTAPLPGYDFRLSPSRAPPRS
jgi:hypothetical protein